MKKLKFDINKDNLFLVVFLIGLLLISLFTKYIGSTDVGDYAYVAKFFAGEFDAKIRSSHSYFYGFLMSPLVKLTNSFILMKLMSVVWLFLIVFSLYYMSRKDKRVLF